MEFAASEALNLRSCVPRLEGNVRRVVDNEGAAWLSVIDLLRALMPRTDNRHSANNTWKALRNANPAIFSGPMFSSFGFFDGAGSRETPVTNSSGVAILASHLKDCRASAEDIKLLVCFINGSRKRARPDSSQDSDSLSLQMRSLELELDKEREERTNLECVLQKTKDSLEVTKRWKNKEIDELQERLHDVEPALRAAESSAAAIRRTNRTQRKELQKMYEARWEEKSDAAAAARDAPLREELRNLMAAAMLRVSTFDKAMREAAVIKAGARTEAASEAAYRDIERFCRDKMAAQMEFEACRDRLYSLNFAATSASVGELRNHIRTLGMNARRTGVCLRNVSDIIRKRFGKLDPRLNSVIRDAIETAFVSKTGHMPDHTESDVFHVDSLYGEEDTAWIQCFLDALGPFVSSACIMYMNIPLDRFV